LDATVQRENWPLVRLAAWIWLWNYKLRDEAVVSDFAVNGWFHFGDVWLPAL
jgi:hypothetical protein